MQCVNNWWIDMYAKCQYKFICTSVVCYLCNYTVERRLQVTRSAWLNSELQLIVSCHLRVTKREYFITLFFLCKQSFYYSTSIVSVFLGLHRRRYRTTIYFQWGAAVFQLNGYSVCSFASVRRIYFYINFIFYCHFQSTNVCG